MLESLVVVAVKILKIAVLGLAALVTPCEDHPVAPAPAAGGGVPTTGSVVLMRELGSVELSDEDATARPELRARVEVVVVPLDEADAV